MKDRWVITQSDRFGTGRKKRKEVGSFAAAWFVLFSDHDYRTQINLKRKRK